MSISGQFLSLLAMIGSGVIAGAFMDMIGTGIDRTQKASYIRRISGLLEGAGWLLAGCFAFAVLFEYRAGEWRMYDPIAQLAGLLLYASLFHRPFRLFGRLVIVLVIRPVTWIIRLVYVCIRAVFRILFTVVYVLLGPIRYIYRRFANLSFKKRAA
ncbi:MULTISPECIES: spore cortex biosynthesis protein YabQ [Sporosarcina]|uniref:spore cortex biosynthesis protein YabQ n=1 Tax=Sporosarcina TaxID=1569 RepID=UPI00058FF7AD|nr:MULTISPECIES: spore cortex biosynthesis protein YabQ [Sporosarcina]WJY26719.1 hypothetical protein QWT68_11730 [Sporosarcina sp. 0.2-SM1T-5]